MVGTRRARGCEQQNVTHNVLREHGRAPASGSGQTETRVRLCWHRAGLAQPGTHRRVASGQGGHCLCEPPVSLGRAQSPRHPACSRGWSQDSERTLPRSCHPGTACALPWRAPLCPGPSLWPCPARTGDTGTGDGPCSREPPPLRVDVAAGPRSAPTPLGMAPPSLSLVTWVLSRVSGARRVRRTPGDWGGCPGK